MEILKSIFNKSSKLKKRIVLTESTDYRILKACEIATKKNLAKIILIGDEVKIKKAAIKYKTSLKGIEIINHLTSNLVENYTKKLFEIRKKKGMTLNNAKTLLQEEIYFATMMVSQGDADGLLSGATHSTAETIKPAFQILGTKKDVKLASSVFLMIEKDKSYVFGDCAINPKPNSQELADIAIASAKTFQSLTNKKPKVAMLSFSTNGSAKHEMVNYVKDATTIAKKKNTDIIIEGEIQLDAAIVPEVAKIKFPKSKLKGKANVLIFPDLNSGNIGYKLVQRFGNVKAIGPILQGLTKPINDLSRGCSVDDIVNMIAITAIMEK